MKNTFHVAHFHFNMVLLTRNMFKEVHVIKSRGALGTGFTYAPVLLFELYLAINNSSTSQECALLGKYSSTSPTGGNQVDGLPPV